MSAPPSDAPVPTGQNDKMRASSTRLRAFADRLAAAGDAEMARHVRLAADELDAARSADAPTRSLTC